MLFMVEIKSWLCCVMLNSSTKCLFCEKTCTVMETTHACAACTDVIFHCFRRYFFVACVQLVAVPVPVLCFVCVVVPLS